MSAAARKLTIAGLVPAILALTQAAAWIVNFQLPTVRIYNAFSGREY